MSNRSDCSRKFSGCSLRFIWATGRLICSFPQEVTASQSWADRRISAGHTPRLANFTASKINFSDVKSIWLFEKVFGVLVALHLSYHTSDLLISARSYSIPKLSWSWISAGHTPRLAIFAASKINFSDLEWLWLFETMFRLHFLFRMSYRTSN